MNGFDNLNDKIVRAIRRQLFLQGHYLTGALEASINPGRKRANGGVLLSAEAAGYLEKLEKGVKAEDIVINETTLAEMTRYVEKRMGYRGRKAMGVALLILKKQQKEGSPTSGSYQYSKTGKRTEVVAETFDNNRIIFTDALDDVVYSDIDAANNVKTGII